MTRRRPVALLALPALALALAGCAGTDAAESDTVAAIPSDEIDWETASDAEVVQAGIDREVGATVPISDLDYLYTGTERFCAIYENETSAVGILDNDFNPLNDFYMEWGEDQGYNRDETLTTALWVVAWTCDLPIAD